jgi:SWI/SNF-related matrix-associated actin-dependent regulator 1 of chromatin subfamily A
VKSLVKENNGSWCQQWKLWRIPKGSYTPIRAGIPRLLPEAEVEDIPLFVDWVCRPMPEKLKVGNSNQMIIYDPMDKHIQPSENPLFPKLYEFQKCTLQLAIKNFGRLMIADEMGVGKTLQSLACALAYEREWPLLIICPSALKHVWVEELRKWLAKRVKREEILVVEKFSGAIPERGVKIVIFSYEVAAKSIEMLGRFTVVIADEAHYLKNSSAKRTLNLVPFLMSRKRVFLLSGTPALAKPREVFNLIQIARPDIFQSLK